MICSHCSSPDTKRHGKDRDGNQRHRCRACGRTCLEKPADPLGSMRVELERAAFALRLLLEGMSVRATERLTGLHRDTICGLILTVGRNCRALLEARVRDVPARDIQCDELWSFTAAKERTRVLRGYGPEVGDCYTFIGMDAETKLILAFHVGRRTLEDADDFAGKLRLAVSGRPQINTDGFAPYRTVIPVNFGWNVDHAVLVKKYGASPDEKGPQRRYSPAQIIGIERARGFGDPDLEKLSTSYVERMNLSVRMGVRRFGRLTNAFSKSRRHHEAMLALFFAWFNFCKRHSAVKATPAVAAKLESEAWTLERLLTEAASTTQS